MFVHKLLFFLKYHFVLQIHLHHPTRGVRDYSPTLNNFYVKFSRYPIWVTITPMYTNNIQHQHLHQKYHTIFKKCNINVCLGPKYDVIGVLHTVVQPEI